MRASIAALTLFVLASAISVAAQKKTITNADLEKYRQQRLNAEREYRENHARLGMPSPEELQKRNEESLRSTAELAARLREEQLERDRFEMERLRSDPPRPATYIPYGGEWAGSRGIAPAYIWSYGSFGSRSRHGRGGFFRSNQSGYYAGGQFWPVGPRTRPRPLIRVRNR